MIPETENTPSWPPVVVVAVAAVTLGGALYLNRPLESQRPSNPSTVLEVPRYPQFPLARLWQDPLHVVYKHWRNTADEQRRAVPFVTGVRDVIAHAAGSDRGADGDQHVLRLLVMLSGMPYSDDRERRRRQRHAVVSALTGSGFVPSDGTRLRYFRAPPFQVPDAPGGLSVPAQASLWTFDEHFAQDSSNEAEAGGPSIEAEAGGPSIGAEAGGPSIGAEAGGPSIGAEAGGPSNDPTLVGYETYEPDLEPGWGNWPLVEVFWLNTEDFLQHPLHKVSALVAALDSRRRDSNDATTVGEATTVLLGPPSSGVLKAMFEEDPNEMPPMIQGFLKQVARHGGVARAHPQPSPRYAGVSPGRPGTRSRLVRPGAVVSHIFPVIRPTPATVGGRRGSIG